MFEHTHLQELMMRGDSHSTTGRAPFRKQNAPDKMLLVGSSALPWQQFLELNPMDLFKK